MKQKLQSQEEIALNFQATEAAGGLSPSAYAQLSCSALCLWLAAPVTLPSGTGLRRHSERSSRAGTGIHFMKCILATVHVPSTVLCARVASTAPISHKTRSP